jgi:hypothetical protein
MLMRPKSSWIRRVAIVSPLWLTLLLPVTSSTEVQIEAEPGANPEITALVQLVRDALSVSSPRAAALKNARVTVGVAAFQQALTTDDGRPLIAAYITSAEFESALGTRPRPVHITAVFNHPDPLDQVALAQALLGRSALGVFDSPAVHSLVARMRSRGVDAIPVSPEQGIDSLLRAADSFDAIIVLPDTTVNRSNVNHVVRTLYGRRAVLIGYSATLTRVGALASVYLPPEAIARSVADVLDQYADNGTVREPVFVRDVDVTLNARLARSLNIALPDRADLVEAVRSRRK